jgi:hypothetical protein
MKPLSSLTTEDLADGICLRAGRIAAAQAELMGWIAEFDRREGWGGTGMLSMAHWLSWRIGLAPGAAREQVRVARRLEDLPAVEAAFGDGRLSYSKIRAITRVAEPDDGIDWVHLGRNSSAAQLEKIVRGVRRAQSVEESAADPELAEWKVRTRKRYDADGNFVMTITTRPEYAPLIEAGLDAKRAELQRELDAQHVDPPSAVPEQPGASDVPAGTPVAAPPPADNADLDAQAPGWPQGTTLRQVRQTSAAFADRWAGTSLTETETRTDRPVPASRTGEPSAPVASAAAPDVPAGTPAHPRATDGEALLALAREALAAEKAAHPDAARRRRPQLTAQIDPLSGWGRQADGELLPPTSLRAVMRTLPGRGGPLRLRPISDGDLRRFDLGRSSRLVSDALRELLATLDGERCRFPGCTRHTKLHAHHVRFWSEGGATDLSNLVLVCSRHHTLIHTQGFQLVLHADRRLVVATADGVPVLHRPAQPWGDPADLATGRGHDVPAGALTPPFYESRLDLRYVVSVVMAQAA